MATFPTASATYPSASTTYPSEFFRPILVREYPPLRLSVDAETPSGRHHRWAPDEPDPANVTTATSFTTTMPGGFEQGAFSLPRKSNTDYGDLERLSTLRVTGAGGQSAWEGRLESSPRVTGADSAVSVGAVGWQAHLDDDKSAREVYVDRDLANWQQMSRESRLAFIALGINVSDGSVSPDTTTGIPAIRLECEGNASTVQQVVFLDYDAGPGNYIGSIYYDFVRGTNVTSSFASTIRTDDSDLFPSSTASANLTSAASSTGTHTAGASERFAELRLNTPAGDGGTDGQTHDVTFRRIAVWGDHGLTKRGTAPDDGLYASDVIRHAITTYAPLLTWASENTETAFVIPHLVFRDPTSAAEILSGVNRFHLRDWAVWENKTFHYHDRGARGKTWRARIAPAQLEETGPSMDRLWNGIIVRYLDVDGTTKTVGPEGSGANTETSEAEDTDPLNPANQLGIRRWDILDMGGVSTPAGATEIASRFLTETRLLNTSGRARLVGHVTDDHGVLYPAWRVRAGDYISFVDASDPSPRRVVRTSYEHDSRTCSVDLDSPAEGLQALLERLQVVLVPILGA